MTRLFNMTESLATAGTLLLAALPFIAMGAI
jgi:hypothetical protein